VDARNGVGVEGVQAGDARHIAPKIAARKPMLVRRII
jgi:hypothetical protein